MDFIHYGIFFDSVDAIAQAWQSDRAFPRTKEKRSL